MFEDLLAGTDCRDRAFGPGVAEALEAFELYEPAISVPSFVCEPTNPYDCATAAVEPFLREPQAPPELALVSEPYAVRLPRPAGEESCPRCGSTFSATGPTGHAGELPICDLCLLEGSPPLGMLLALAAVVRAFGAVEAPAGEEYHEALEELASFARVYERFASRFGPARSFRLPDLEEL